MGNLLTRMTKKTRMVSCKILSGSGPHVHHLPLGDRVGHIGDGDSDCDSDDDGSCYDNLEDVASPPPILGHGLDLGQPRQDLGLRVGISFFTILRKRKAINLY